VTGFLNRITTLIHYTKEIKSYFTLKMEAVWYSETLLSYRKTTQRHILRINYNEGKCGFSVKLIICFYPCSSNIAHLWGR